MTTALSPREVLNKAFLKVKPTRNQIESFKKELALLVKHVDTKESEENQKNLLINFLKKSHFEEDYFINTKDRIDLVIHNGNTAKSSVGVLFEVKRTANINEMPSKERLNSKALQELLLYYLRERISSKNIEIKHLVITNTSEWFVFDANLFEKVFADDKKLVRLFKEFELDKGKDTGFFYSQIASDAIERHKDSLEFTYFDLSKLPKSSLNETSKSDSKLIPLYKILSPEHLLKKPFLNDSNSLNKNFYSELLHLIGLEEVKEGSKKLIKRKQEGERNGASLLESAMVQIKTKGKLYQVRDVEQYGSSEEEQSQQIALDLALTWINRLLFLKLLEAQLVKYHNGSRSYAFLNTELVKSYDDLEALFFQVLAVKPDERDEQNKEKFKFVPYLNSSLFEPTKKEHEALFISSLSDSARLPIVKNTVLKNESGKRRAGELPTLEYIFEFLNCYDFTTEGGEEIQEDNKALISASVLGLIFEKINGYKDGSFYTPSFVTMYMCRSAITNAVIKKFNLVKGWRCKNLIDLFNQIDDKREANEIINSIKVCDPAVGSGHFLVSALNEFIYIKSKLGLLFDNEGKSLKNYNFELVNDELIVTDDEDAFVEYKPTNRESQRVQETLFREKQTIIESCLFGVDINPNSTKICRLRLWIELLKNAYYKESGELETLPNIDINIKTGDSLISKFGIDGDLKEALKKSKVSVSDYKSAVQKYKNASDKSEKRQLENLIEKIKKSLKEEILDSDPKYVKVRQLELNLMVVEGQKSLFELDAVKVASNKKIIEKIKADLLVAKKVVADIEENKIYKNAFEWRIEFPEVLGSDGGYEGFDVVVGNPPYIDSETMVKEGLESQREFIAANFKLTKGNWDIYIAFFERGLDLLKGQGDLIYITPDKWLSKGFGLTLREQGLASLTDVTQVGRDVFENAKVDSIISLFSKENTKSLTLGKFLENEYRQVNKVDKVDVKPPYAIDYLFSESLDSLAAVERVNGKVKDFLVCESACATSDCYELKPFIQELDASTEQVDYYFVVNTGTLSKYTTRWGSKEMTYLKSKYLKPVVEKSIFAENFKNTYYTKSNLPKLIIKGLTKLDVSLDPLGTTIAGKSTLVVTSMDLTKLKLLCGVLNSSLAIKYVAEKYASASYNGGVSFTKEMINEFPFPLGDSPLKQQIVSLVDQAIANPAEVDRIQGQIDLLTLELYELSDLDVADLFGVSSASLLVNEIH